MRPTPRAGESRDERSAGRTYQSDVEGNHPSTLASGMAWLGKVEPARRTVGGRCRRGQGYLLSLRMSDSKVSSRPRPAGRWTSSMGRVFVGQTSGVVFHEMDVVCDAGSASCTRTSAVPRCGVHELGLGRWRDSRIDDPVTALLATVAPVRKEVYWTHTMGIAPLVRSTRRRRNPYKNSEENGDAESYAGRAVQVAQKQDQPGHSRYS